MPAARSTGAPRADLRQTAARPCHVVVGSGPAGLAAALLLSETAPGGRVVLLEPKSRIGGLWRSFDYGPHGKFDYGMHNLFECGDVRLDRLLAGLLPSDEWVRLEGASRDVAGVFYHGRLQTNSPSIDLRFWPPAERAALAAEIEAAAAQPPERAKAAENVRDFALAWWGETVADRVLPPVMRKLFGHAPAELDLMALRLTALSRIVLFDADRMLELMPFDRLRERLAFPDQRDLPCQYQAGRKGLYPRRRGMQHLVDAVRARLLSRHVEILTDAVVEQIESRNGRVAALSVGGPEGLRRIDGIEAVFWAAGLNSALTALNCQKPPGTPDPAQSLTLVHLLVDRHADAEGLHYLYCYDEGYRTFRATLYAHFLGQRPGGQPITVELVNVETEDAIAVALRELRAFGILDPASDIRFATAEPMGAIWPMPTLRNHQAAEHGRTVLHDRRLTNLHLIGQAARPRLFFQGEVMRHVLETLEPYLQGGTH